MSFTLSVSVESRSTSSSVTSDPVSAFSSVWDTAYSEKERIERVGFSFVSLFVWAEQGPLNYFCMQCVHHGAMQHLHPQNEDSAGIYLLHFISTLSTDSSVLHMRLPKDIISHSLKCQNTYIQYWYWTFPKKRDPQNEMKHPNMGHLQQQQQQH